jgi:two-component system CheB/CheR fusion protein
VEFSSRVAPVPSPQLGAANRRRQARSPDQELQAETNRVLLERYAPPAIVVDDKSMIVRSQGATASYLELPTGDVNLDVLRMIRPGLMSPLRSALHEAAEGRVTVRKSGLQFMAHEKVCEVAIEVTPLGGADSRHYLILFDGADTLRRAEPTVVAESAPAVTQMQQELADTRLHLQSMIQELESANEELQAANEEILSSNEELQSTNEELDTAREELQSSNEELSTVNDELHARNFDLSRAISDLNNLLGSVQIPIVMVTADARIRRFTPAAEPVLNLIPSDIGRPIGHIKPNVIYPDLEQVMLKVVETVTADEREVEDSEGHTYVATARPYKSVDHRIDGAVLALFDVSSTLRAARETGEAIISTVRDAVLMLDSDHSIRRVNQAFTQHFGHTDASVHGKSIFQIADGRWNIPPLRYLLQEVLPRDQRVQDFQVELDLPALGTRRFYIDGRCIESNRKGERVVWLIVREESRGKSP